MLAQLGHEPLLDGRRNVRLVPAASAAWQHVLAVTRPALLLAPAEYLGEVRKRLHDAGVVAAVASRDPAPLFDWVVEMLARQGISNLAAEVFAERNGSPTWHGVSAAMAAEARCLRLRSHWHFHGCGYRRGAATCSTPHHALLCPVTTAPARKGSLAEAAIALWLFVRDVASGDLVGWLDARLAAADPGVAHPHRDAVLRAAVLDPLVHLPGTGKKVWSMVLAELLLGADPERERWITAGAGFVAVDSLVHAFLSRTGILRRLDVEHPYGLGCYAPGGCAEVVAGLAARIDAREFDSSLPAACLPRWVQWCIWWFCAAGGINQCNANKINDTVRCQQRFCPVYARCDRINISDRL